MSYAAIVNSARSDFLTLVATPLGLSFSWDNASFSPPDTDAVEPRWVDVAVRFDDTEQRSSSGKRQTFRRSGSMHADIYVPVGDMDGAALELADVITGAFRNLSGSVNRYGDPKMSSAPMRADLLGRRSNVGSEWWVVPFEVPFYSDLTVATTQPAAGSTGFENVGNTIRTRFKTLISDPQALTVVWDNDDITDEPDDELWVRLATRIGPTKVANLGALDYRTRGAVYAMIHAPFGAGDGETLDLVDIIDAQFRAVSDGGVTFMAPTPRVVGRVREWWQTNLACPFMYDEVVVPP